MNLKLSDLKLAQEKHKTEAMDRMGQEIDEEKFKAKILKTLENLENTPKDRHRPIFTNLIKFVEIKPMKIRIGMYASAKATGTDALDSDFKKSVIPSNKPSTTLDIPNRGGSSTVVSGALRGT
jgi:hypothetical protein